MIRLIRTKNYADAFRTAAEIVGRGSASLRTRWYVFSEDKLTLSLESAIAERRGGGAFNVTVSTFSRYLARSGGTSRRVLSKEGSAMAIRRILSERDVGCFRTSAAHAGFAPALYELIAQIKSAKVGPDDLARSSAEATGLLKRKLCDLVEVYRAYEEFLEKNEYCDENSFLALLPERIAADGDIRGAEVIAVAYSSFTRQAQEILTALMRRAANFTAIVPDGDNSNVYTGETARAVRDAARNAGLPLEEETAPTDATGEGAHIADSAYVPDAGSLETDRVFAYEGADPADEAEFIARNIRSAVRGGARYRDVSVLTGSADAARPVARALAAYDVPFYLDERMKLSAHPLSAFVFGALELFRRNFDPKDLVRLAKNPIACPDRRAADEFENLLFRRSATRKAVRRPFPEAGKEEELRAFLVGLGERFGERRTAADIARAVRECLAAADAEKRLADIAARMEELGERPFASVTEQAAEKWEELLSETERVLGDAPVTVKDYLALVRAGAEAAEIAALPPFRDAVYLGEFGAALAADYVFAAGLTDAVPGVRADTAILSDRDLEALSNYRVLVEPTIRAVNSREKETAVLALTAFRKRLFLTWPRLGAGGKEVRRSELVGIAEKLFRRGGKPLPVWTRGRLESAARRGGQSGLRYRASEFSAPRPALLRFSREASDFRKGFRNDFTAAASYYAALPDKAQADAVLGRANSEIAPLLRGGLPIAGLSASALERYFGCPYRFFLDSGLRLEAREDGSVRPLDSGLLLHRVAELFMRECDGIPDEETARRRGEELFDEVAKDPAYTRYLARAAHRDLFRRMREEAGRTAAAIFRQNANSSFRVLGEEISFGGKKDKYPPVVLRVHGRAIPISGKVDRVDVSDDRFRVIDYKTGSVKEGEEQLYTGNKLQLWLYANAFTDGGRMRPAGCYYFPISDEFAKDADEAYRLLGRTLKNASILMKMDRTLEGGGKSAALGVSIRMGENGEVKFGGGKSVVGEEELDAFLRYAVRVSEVAAGEMEDGFILPVPASEANCSYCPYGGACRRDERGGVREAVKGIDAGFILRSVLADEKARGEKDGEESGDESGRADGDGRGFPSGTREKESAE